MTEEEVRKKYAATDMRTVVTQCPKDEEELTKWRLGGAVCPKCHTVYSQNDLMDVAIKQAADHG